MGDLRIELQAHVVSYSAEPGEVMHYAFLKLNIQFNSDGCFAFKSSCTYLCNPRCEKICL